MTKHDNFINYLLKKLEASGFRVMWPGTKPQGQNDVFIAFDELVEYENLDLLSEKVCKCPECPKE